LEPPLPHTAPTASFQTLGLSPEALTSLEKAGYTQPTPIQVQAIPPALAGRDVIGCAATGTGKTAAFALPLVERLAGKEGTRALVLAPTRELALQIAEHVKMFGASRQVRCAIIIGGVGMAGQVHALRSGYQIVIATPGRLVDHLQQGTAKFDALEVLVLDEADRMLDMGFKPQLTRILAKLPRKRQTMLFSATMAGEVAGFAKTHLHDPVRVEVSRSGTTAARADQRVYLVSQNEKTALLLALLAEDDESTLVFTRTKRRADRVARSLERARQKATRIHADRSQSARVTALEGFRSGRYRVLVATDIAARGLDVAEIGHVVNYDLPHVPEDYVHRVGRTARAAASGRASSFVSPEEVPLLRDIERLTRTEVPRADVPRDSPIFKAEAARQANPGPAQQGHHQSTRPPGQPLGRHARTHPKKPRPVEQATASSAPSHRTAQHERQRSGPPRSNAPHAGQRGDGSSSNAPHQGQRSGPRRSSAPHAGQRGDGSSSSAPRSGKHGPPSGFGGRPHGRPEGR
jgi:ATP-dependent RNA helicase RhlE